MNPKLILLLLLFLSTANVPGSTLHSVPVNFMEKQQCENAFQSTFLGKYFQLHQSYSCVMPIQTGQDLCDVRAKNFSSLSGKSFPFN